MAVQHPCGRRIPRPEWGRPRPAYGIPARPGIGHGMAPGTLAKRPSRMRRLARVEAAGGIHVLRPFNGRARFEKTL